MSRTFRRTGASSPCQPTASSGLNGYVIVETAPRRFTSTCHSRVAGLLRAERVVDARRVEHRRIEDRVRPDESLLGQHVARVAGFDHAARSIGAVGLEPPHRAARQHHVVAGRDREVTEIADRDRPCQRGRTAARRRPRCARVAPCCAAGARNARGTSCWRAPPAPTRDSSPTSGSCSGRAHAGAAALRSWSSPWADGGGERTRRGRRTLPCSSRARTCRRAGRSAPGARPCLRRARPGCNASCCWSPWPEARAGTAWHCRVFSTRCPTSARIR